MTATEVLGTAERIDDLLARAESLDGTNFEAVYSHYHDALTRYGAAQGSTDPEGVANLALFDVYRAFKRSPIRSEPQFRAYLYRAAKHHVIGERRRKVATPIEVEDGVLSEADGTEALVTREWLLSLVDGLPPEQRSVIEHRYLDDLTAAQTGNELGKATNAVYQTQHRAITNLRRLVIAVAVIVVLAASIAVWRQVADGRTFVDNGPADVIETTTTIVVDPAPGGRLPATGELGGDVGSNFLGSNPERPAEAEADSAGSAADSTVDSQPATTVDSAPAGSASPEEIDSIESTETTAAANVTVPAAKAGQDAASKGPVTTAESQASSDSTAKGLPSAEETDPTKGTVASPSGGTKPASPDSRLTVCRQTPVQDGLTAVVFFQSKTVQEARQFEEPEAIRFAGIKSVPIDEFDVSLPSPPGIQSGSFGWLTIENEAVTITSTPSGDAAQEWGLVYNNEGSSWLKVEYLDFSASGSLVWRHIAACTP